MAQSKLTPDEIARRRPVWIALSDLFLDTELVDWEIDHLAKVLASSGFTGPELEGIYRDEVAPVLGANLLSVAGVWSGFDEDWLVETLSKRRRPGPIRAWLTRKLYSFVMRRPVWKRVCDRVPCLREAHS